MVSIGETRRTEIDGEQVEVQVIDKSPISVLLEETRIRDNSFTAFDIRGDDRVAVSPQGRTATWMDSEVRSIIHSPWEIVGVEDGKFGPTLVLQRHE